MLVAIKADGRKINDTKIKTSIDLEYDPAEREILRNILVSSYQVFEAVGEDEALQLLEHQKRRISLILLGASMQIMAEDCLLKLKSMDSTYSSIPVIAVVSSNEENGYASRFASLRFPSDIICKPGSHRLSFVGLIISSACVSIPPW